jgi:hypothetical protein
MYDMKAYLGKQSQDVSANVTLAHGTVLQLARRVEDVGHKLYMDNYFTSPDLFEDLYKRKIVCCGKAKQSSPAVCHGGVWGERSYSSYSFLT